MNANIDPFEPCETCPDWHAVATIQLGELIECGVVDFKDPSWHWDAYSEEQYERVCEKITNRYYMREIGVIPPGLWKREFLRKMNEIMPKYKPLYKALENGADIMQTGDQYGKSRDIFSEFPATMLGDNQDYASNGRDREYENVTQGDWIEKATQIAERYNDIDVMILKEIEPLFSCLLTMSMNGY
jgi:hypothetical protein